MSIMKIFITPRSRKLIVIIFAMILGTMAFREVHFQYQLSRLSHASVNQLFKLTLRGSHQERRAVRKLESLLSHPYANVRYRAAWHLKRLRYEPDTDQEIFRFAIASRQYHLVPFQYDEIIEFYLSSPELEEVPPSIPFNWIDPRIHEVHRSIAHYYLENIPAIESMTEEEQKQEARSIQLLLKRLSTIRSSADIPIIRGFTEHPFESVQLRALQHLVSFRDYEIIPLLLEKSTKWDEENRSDQSHTRGQRIHLLNDAMYRMPDDRWLPLILSNINANDQESPLFRNAIKARLDHPDVIRAIAEIYASEPDSDLILNGFRYQTVRDSTHTEDTLERVWRNHEVIQKIIDHHKPEFPQRRGTPGFRSTQQTTERSNTHEFSQSEAQAHIEKKIEEIKTDMLQAVRQGALESDAVRSFRDRIQALADQTDHPDLLPAIMVYHFFMNHGLPEDLGFAYLGRNQYPHAYLLMTRSLNFQQPIFSAEIYAGLAALQDSRTIPDLLQRLPYRNTFQPAMRLLERLDWTPSTDVEKAYESIYRNSPEQSETEKKLVHDFLKTQLNSTEVRRREFASHIIIGQNRSDLFPDLIHMLEQREDGRIAVLLHHSEVPELQAAAQRWLDNAPIGIQFSGN
jgi:hypothetical protein